LWNYTLTRFWTNTLNNLINTKKYNSFDELYRDNKDIRYGSYFNNFYTMGTLFSQTAKKEWVPPEFNRIQERKDVQKRTEEYMKKSKFPRHF
jgi:hypothetical protein